MATNLDIDDKLLEEAQNIGRHKTKKETVNTALLEYIQRHKQEKIIHLFGSVEYNSDYDYKAGRNRE